MGGGHGPPSVPPSWGCLPLWVSGNRRPNRQKRVYWMCFAGDGAGGRLAGQRRPSTRHADHAQDGLRRMERDAVITKLSKPSVVILLASLSLNVGYCKSEEAPKEARGSPLADTVTPEETNLTQLSADTAKVLARHKGSLALDGLKELTPDVAEPLATCSVSLSLNGLTTLTPETAQLLATRSAGTNLSSLREPRG